eukprot:679992-Prymnesium_polylepis.1
MLHLLGSGVGGLRRGRLCARHALSVACRASRVACVWEPPKRGLLSGASLNRALLGVAVGGGSR